MSSTYGKYTPLMLGIKDSSLSLLRFLSPLSLFSCKLPFFPYKYLINRPIKSWKSEYYQIRCKIDVHSDYLNIYIRNCLIFKT